MVFGGGIVSSPQSLQILVRYFDKPRIAHYLLITIGTDTEIDHLLTAIADIKAGLS